MPFDFVVSGDSHLVEPWDLWEKALGRKWGDAVPRLIDTTIGGEKATYFFTGREYMAVDAGVVDTSSGDAEMVQRAGWDPDTRIKCLDIDRVDAEVLNSTWSLYTMRIENPELRRDCQRVYNDWAVEFVSRHRDRFVATAMLPIDDVAWACKEVERVIARGLRGAILFADTPPGTRPYRDPAYDPLWALAQSANFPLMLHIITGNVADPFTYQGTKREDSMRDLINIFYEAVPVLANEFIFGGILDRFPDLKLVLGEYEVSWLPHFCWRMDQAQDAFSAPFRLRKLERRASDYVVKRVYHGFIDDPLLYQVHERFGADVRIMWGSDFPHVRCTYPRTHEVLERVLAPLPREYQRRVAGLTAAELFGIPNPAKAKA